MNGAAIAAEVLAGLREAGQAVGNGPLVFTFTREAEVEFPWEVLNPDPEPPVVSRFIVLDTDGNSFAVPFIVLDGDGNSFTVPRAVLDNDADSYMVAAA